MGIPAPRPQAPPPAIESRPASAAPAVENQAAVPVQTVAPAYDLKIAIVYPTPVRQLIMGMMKAYMTRLIRDRKIYKAADELCTFLLTWNLCPPKTVELLCICAAIEPPSVFLEAILCLA